MASGSRGRSQSNKGRRATKGRQPAPTTIRGTLAGDVVGVVLLVCAIAMAIAVISPSSAVITSTMGELLTLTFGVGAILCPIALALFACSLFVPDEQHGAGRIALGLVLIVLALLGLVSINNAQTVADPNLALSSSVVILCGGYIGGALAWLLLNLVGQAVGNVMLVGLAVIGSVVCGFSISGLFEKVGSRAKQSRQAHAEARERQQLYAQQLAAAKDEITPDMTKAQGLGFIGDRTRSVLKRAATPMPVQSATSSIEATAEQKTTLLRDNDSTKTTLLGNLKTRRLARKAKQVDSESVPEAISISNFPADDGKPSQMLLHRSEGSAEGPKTSGAKQVAAEVEPVVPDWLRNAKHSEGESSPSSSERHVVQKKTSKRSRKSSPVAVQAATSSSSRKAPVVNAGSIKRPGDSDESYTLPPMNMLASNPNSAAASSSREELEETKQRLQGTLEEFGLTSKVVDYVSGPMVTTFRVEMGEGERVSRIKGLEDDIALTLAAEKVRIFAPIRGTSYVGIEIPNRKRTNVNLGDVLPYAKGGPLEVAIGRDSAGRPVIADIAKMPHMLVAGTTGSGKSVLINSMIMSLLMRTTPKQVRLIMIDPKRVEFSGYNGLPHLYVPVVTEPRQAASALSWAVSEMERRLKVFERAGARNIGAYNRMCTDGKLAEMDNPPDPMPFIVIVIDELSDLMMVAGKDVEASIVRIAQLARAAGIHLVIATQRPSANVVTGLIKSNIDSRVALKVSSGIDSRVILDETGAERLLGNGDMLFKDRGLAPRRVLGCYTSDQEIENVVSFIRDQAEPDYHEEILSQVVPGQTTSGSSLRSDANDDDPLVWEAAQIVVNSQLGSTSGLQRRLKVGYARAGRIMDMLEEKGIVGPPDGSKPREVLLDKDGLEELRAQEAKYREV